MEFFYYRGQKCKHCGDVVPVFGLGHHKPKDEGEDAFTKCVINFYNYGNEREKGYLMQKLLALYKERFEGDLHFDFLCIIPTHEKDGINPHMRAFAEEFAKATGIQFMQALRRKQTIKGQHELRNKDERIANVTDSLEIICDVNGKNALVIDNLAIYGANAQEAYHALRRAGAKAIYFLCFGLGSKGRECDFDLHPNFKKKASYIVANFHWPKVSVEKRREHADGKDSL